MSYQIDNASKQYQDLALVGEGRPSNYNQQLQGLLSQFAGNAGINYGLPNPNQAVGNPTQGQITVGGVPQGGQSSPAPVPGNAGSFNAQNQQFHQAGMQSNTPQGPYSLDQNQQQLLNQSIDNIQKSHQANLAEFQQSMASRGITDPAAINAGTTQLTEHFNKLAAETSTSFYQEIKAAKQKELAALISAQTGLQEQGLAGLTQTGQIHEAGARAEQAYGTDLIGSILGNATGLASKLTGNPAANVARYTGGDGGGAPASLPSNYGLGPSPLSNPAVQQSLARILGGGPF